MFYCVLKNDSLRIKCQDVAPTYKKLGFQSSKDNKFESAFLSIALYFRESTAFWKVRWFLAARSRR